jgi:hypothetical protein
MVAVEVVGVAGGEEGPVKLKLGVACCVAILYVYQVSNRIVVVCMPGSRR